MLSGNYRHSSRTRLIISLSLGIAGLCAVYSAINPENARWMPKCIFRSLTGLECAGCGSQRALHAILTGHPVAAIQYNFAWLPGIPLLVLCAVAEIFPSKFPTLRRLICSRNFCIAVLAFLLLWTIVRNMII